MSGIDSSVPISRATVVIADKAIFDALVAADKALTEAYEALENPIIADIAHTQVSIRVALAKVRSQFK